MIEAIFTNGVDEITAAGLTQWDTGQKLKIQLSDLPAKFQVHFANYKCSKEAYVVEATSDGGVATVPIPNIILQQASRALAWVYITDADNGAETIKTIYLPIQGRAKPSDYAYTEIEILTVERAIIAANEAEAAAETAKAIAADSVNMEARISRNEKRITNLEKGLMSNSFETDSDVAYIKEVPENALPYAAISKIGGMTKKCNNLFKVEPSYMGTKNGLTATLNADGTVTINGTAAAQTDFYLTTNKYLPAGNYIFKYDNPGMGWNSYWGTLYNVTQGKIIGYDIGAGVAFTSSGETFQMQITIGSGKTLNNVVFKPMVNAGSTALPYEPYFDGLRDGKVTQVKSVGANVLKIEGNNFIGDGARDENGWFLTSNNGLAIQSYWDGGQYSFTSKNNYLNITAYNNSGYLWLSRFVKLQPNTTYRVTSSIAREIVGLNDTATGTVGTKISVTGGVFNSGNYKYWMISFYGTGSANVMIIKGEEESEFSPYTEHTLTIPEAVQSLEGYGLGIDNTYRNYIDFDSKKFNRLCAKDTWNGAESNITYVSATGLFRLLLSNNAIKDTSGVCNLYGVYVGAYQSCPDQHIMIAPISITGDKNVIFVKDSRFTTAEAFKAHLTSNNLSVVYMLETPVIEDISDLITSDNLIGVEVGGTLTFVNEYGYDVPSEVVYQIEGVTA